MFDRLDEPSPIGVAVSGRPLCEIAGEQGDFVIAVEPKRELIEMFHEAGGEGNPGVGQIPVCWGPDEAECRTLAREQFRWAAAGWKVMAELPNPITFDAYSQFVKEEDVAQMIPCGPETEGIVQGVKQFVDAGFDRVALVQVGDRQKEFCEFYRSELAEALRAL
ncbi:MAG: hypothetical protein QOI57_2776 [Rubrobacteraceae bacterium]|nr:hypothetical protein [Rubrobacteraceae bacterium]